jgi:hypothetical protein
MRIRCARCGVAFEPWAEYHILCPECWEEVGLFGDSESMKFWRTASSWANGTWTREELKELADSAVGQEIVKDILSEMDMACKLTLLRQEIEKRQ